MKKRLSAWGKEKTSRQEIQGDRHQEIKTLDRPELKLRILAMSSADRLGDTSLLICLTVQAIMMVLVEKREDITDYSFKRVAQSM